MSEDSYKRVKVSKEKYESLLMANTELVKALREAADKLNRAISGNRPRSCMEDVEKALRAIADKYEVK